jgi:hypothetical protein
MADKNSWRMTRLSRNSPNMRLVTMLSSVRALRARYACVRGFRSGRIQEPLPFEIITRPPYEATDGLFYFQPGQSTARHIASA